MKDLQEMALMFITFMMSLLPYVLDDMMGLRRPSDLFDQFFGVPVTVEDLMPTSSLVGPLRAGYLRPWRSLAASQSGVSQIVNDKDQFKVNLDVQQFKPEELNVKTSDGYVVIEGKHEERPDEHGYIQRHFQRRYRLPQGVEEDKVVSTLSSDGVLTVTAPKMALPAPEGARAVPIQQTQQPAVPAKQQR